MPGVRWIVGGAALATVLAALSSTPSLADFGMGGRDGLRYRADVATSGASKVRCPPGTHVIGGGFGGLPLYQQFPQALSPFDGDDVNDRPDDGWRLDVRGAGSDGTTTAVCTRDPVAYPRTGSRVGRNDGASAKAMCPPGTHVAGGGVRARGVRLNSSYPVDSNDLDAVPDDGWRARVFNAAGEPVEFRVYGLCNPSEPVYKIARDQWNLNGSGGRVGSDIRRSCPSGREAIAAGLSTGVRASDGWLLRHLRVRDGTDGGRVPDDGVRASFFLHDASRGPVTVRIFAVCQ